MTDWRSVVHKGSRPSNQGYHAGMTSKNNFPWSGVHQ